MPRSLAILRNSRVSLPQSFIFNCRSLQSFPREACRRLCHFGVGRTSSTILHASHTGSDQQHAWLRKDLHVVLVNPVIPQNTGSIARTCAATGIGLHLVGPMGFKIDDKRLKRAGLDYWDFVAVRQYETWQDFHEHFLSLPEPRRLVGFSKFASTHYATEGQYLQGDWLVFGSETNGLPDEVHELLPASQMVKIPMRQRYVRSLNLAVSAGIGIFEAIRQLDGAFFPDSD